jgi:hypothetical protein
LTVLDEAAAAAEKLQLLQHVAQIRGWQEEIRAGGN